ncbi:MAG: phage tail assembly chaperone [Pseudomonadota bacterium]
MSRTSPWPQLIATAGRLGVPPEAFWRLSLVEWRALARTGDAPALSRVQLERLALQFPDAAMLNGERDGDKS